MTYKTDKGFKTIAVSGQSDVVADANTDTLTLVAGSNVTLTTDASADSITIAASGGGGGGDVATLTDADGDTKVQVEEGSDEDKIRFDTAGSQRMIITDAGKVGIGVDAPSYKLDVDGDIRIRGNDIRDNSGNPAIQMDGSANVTVTNSLTVDGDGSSGGVTVTDGAIAMKTGTGSVAKIDMYCEVSNAHKISIQAPAHSDFSGDVNFRLPASNGTSGQALVTDGSGNTSWSTVSGGGSSSDTFNIDHFGRFRWSQNQIHGHHTYNENARYSYINTTLSGKATYSDGTINCPTFTATIVNSLLYIRSGIVPVNCTLDAFTVDGYWTVNLSDGNAKWSMWRAPAPSDATNYDNTVTWTRIGSVTWPGTGTDDTYNKGSTTISSGNSYNAGDWFALTVQPGGSDVYTGSSTNNAFSMSSQWSVS
ncbi:MAG: hypothetical protein VXZ06_03120 [Actinomycetota bacterium]|nr:hypothetical protein [Actinomycetota bacterium]